jgi:hypothetical protein
VCLRPDVLSTTFIALYFNGNLSTYIMQILSRKENTIGQPGNRIFQQNPMQR